ncbi:hypothetical protein KKC32_02860 [Patescibacteria group bacterium]|nr:hypothetical protein [Patescibacteria group bacterium]
MASYLITLSLVLLLAGLALSLKNHGFRGISAVGIWPFILVFVLIFFFIYFIDEAAEESNFERQLLCQYSWDEMEISADKNGIKIFNQSRASISDISYDINGCEGSVQRLEPNISVSIAHAPINDRIGGSISYKGESKSFDFSRCRTF